MDVLLFDQHTDGHHLEYASNLATHIEEAASDISVTVLLGDRPAKLDQYFEPRTVEFLFESPDHGKREIVQQLTPYLSQSNHDLVHFLQIDDIVPRLYRRLDPSQTPLTAATLNGSFFHHHTNLSGKPLELCDKVIESWLFGPQLVQTVESFASKITAHPQVPIETPGTPVSYLYLSFYAGLIDHLFVHTSTAEEYVTRLSPSAIQTSVVPDPVEPTFASTYTREQARAELGLPAEKPILLFFGEARREKGPQFLLDALSYYEGRPFTLVFAGPPDDVTATDVEQAREVTSIDIIDVFEFINQEDVPLYFSATDIVVLPYQRSFGARRMSGVFQKAAAANRPVIAPDFGEFAVRVEEHDLGAKFDPDSEHDLCQTIASVISNPDFYNSNQMDAYVEYNSYDRLAAETVSAYRSLM